MLHLLTTISKFTMIFIMALYTFYSYRALSPRISEERSDRLYRMQTSLVMLLFINGYIVILLHTLYGEAEEGATSVSAAQQMLVLFLAELVLTLFPMTVATPSRFQAARATIQFG